MVTTCAWLSRPTWSASSNQRGSLRWHTDRTPGNKWTWPRDWSDNYAANIEDPVVTLDEVIQNVTQVKAEKTTALTSLSHGADLLVAAFNEQGWLPILLNITVFRCCAAFLPVAGRGLGEMCTQLTRQTDNAQRERIALPKAPETRGDALWRSRLTTRSACQDRPRNGWSRTLRRVVGALTLGLAGDADDEVLSWIAEGAPPIYFGFGSTPLASPAETVAVIGRLARD